MALRGPLVLSGILAAFSGNICAQHDSDYNKEAARVGASVITAGDVLERVELMPWEGKEAAGDSIPFKALASLVAEKLLALEAFELGMGREPSTLALYRTFERIFSRDELYRIEVTAKVRISYEEVEAALPRCGVENRIVVFKVRSLAEARDLASVLSSSHPHTTALPGDTITVTFSDLPEPYEDTVYAMKKPGEARWAFSRGSGWKVFQFLHRSTSARTAEEQRTLAEREIRSRREAVRTGEFYREMFGKEHVRMDSSLFHLLAKTLLGIVSNTQRSGSFYSSEDIDTLFDLLKGRMGEVLVTIGEDSLTLGESMGELRFFPCRFAESDERLFTLEFNNCIRGVIDAGFFSRKALQTGMNFRPAVRADLNSWMEYWQAAKLVQRVTDSSSGGGESIEAREQAIDRYLVTLANKYGVKLNDGVLKNLPVLHSNMVTNRTIGFGGSLLAVPILTPRWRWIFRWQKTTAP